MCWHCEQVRATATARSACATRPLARRPLLRTVAWPVILVGSGRESGSRRRHDVMHRPTCVFISCGGRGLPRTCCLALLHSIQIDADIHDGGKHRRTPPDRYGVYAKAARLPVATMLAPATAGISTRLVSFFLLVYSYYFFRTQNFVFIKDQGRGDTSKLRRLNQLNMMAYGWDK